MSTLRQLLDAFARASYDVVRDGGKFGTREQADLKRRELVDYIETASRANDFVHTVFGWWDHFNDCFVGLPETARRAHEFGNKVTELYTVQRRAKVFNGTVIMCRQCLSQKHEGKVGDACPKCPGVLEVIRTRVIPNTECLDCGALKTECPADCARVIANGGTFRGAEELPSVDVQPVKSVKRGGNFCNCVYKCGDAPGWEDRACAVPYGLLFPRVEPPKTVEFEAASLTSTVEGYACVRADCERTPGADCRSCLQRWSKPEFKRLDDAPGVQMTSGTPRTAEVERTVNLSAFGPTPTQSHNERAYYWMRDHARALERELAACERHCAIAIDHKNQAIARAAGSVPKLGLPPVIDPKDVFQWHGDLDAFAAWFGEKMPVDFGGQISVPVYRSPEGKWSGRWLRVWCGSWIVRRADDKGEGRRHYTFPNEEFQWLISPLVAGSAPKERDHG